MMVKVVRGERPLLTAEAKFLDWLIETSADRVIELETPEQRAALLEEYGDLVLAEREKMFEEILRNPTG